MQQLLKKLQVNTTKLILIIKKKILFSALACVAFAGSAFASNDIVNEKNISLNRAKQEIKDSDAAAPCGVTIVVGYYRADGAFIAIDSGQYTSENRGSACTD